MYPIIRRYILLSYESRRARFVNVDSHFFQRFYFPQASWRNFKKDEKKESKGPKGKKRTHKISPSLDVFIIFYLLCAYILRRVCVSRKIFEILEGLSVTENAHGANVCNNDAWWWRLHRASKFSAFYFSPTFCARSRYVCTYAHIGRTATTVT